MAKQFAIDFKHFKKTASDKNTTTLTHKDGHQITIAHHALTPKMRGQLAELPQDSAKPAPKMLAAGGDPQDGPSTQDVQNAADNSQNPQAPVTINIGTPNAQPVQQAPAPTNQPFTGVMGTAASDAPYGTPPQVKAPDNNIPQQQEEPKQAEAPSPAQQQQPTAQAPQNAPNPGVNSQPTQAPDPFGTNAYLGELQKGIGEQKAGITGQAQAEGAASRAQAADLQQQVAAQQKVQSDYQTHFQELDAERKAFQKDLMDQHIDPNHFLGSKDTVGKVGTAIGLILGGLSGINGSPNPALEFLNKQIDRDIAAQRANVENKQTLLQANMRQFGNLKDATEMTRLMMADTIKNKLLMESAKVGDQAAKARALDAAGKLDTQYAPVMGQIATRQALLGNVKAGNIPPSAYLRAVVPEGEKAGVGKEIQEAQNLASVRDHTLSAFDQISKIGIGDRAMSPIQTSRQVAALKGAALDKLTKDTSGRVTPETVKLIGSAFDTMLANPKTIATQRQVIDGLLTQNMHFPLAEQYMPRELLVKGLYSPSGQSRIKENAPILPK